MPRSRWHTQALGELRAIAADSAGTIAIVNISEPDAAGLLGIDVSVDCSGVHHASKGLRLRRRERVTLLVPADFPFAYPHVVVAHRRFADAAHVQWGKWLCLYRSPSTEWDPSDGMFGFIERLLTWLERGAADELDPAGQPLHPPVAYTSRDAGCVVVRPNAPQAGDTPWVGAAVLRRISDARTDVVGWLGVDEPWPSTPEALQSVIPAGSLVGDDDGTNVFLGLTIVLVEPIAFETPDTAAGLVAALTTQGVPRDRFLGLLGLVAAWNERLHSHLQAGSTNNADDVNGRRTFPLYVLVGTPSRGVAGTDRRLTHLVAWRLPDLGEQIASLLINAWSTDARLAEIGARVWELASDWLADARTRWARVFEHRPEIVVRRDVGSPAEWLTGKRVLVLGCGALGAPVAEQCTRADAAQIIVADNGVVNPGILVRQPYDDADIGRNKAVVLAERLRRIRPDLAVVPIADDVRTSLLAEGAGIPAVDLVIDATANRAVALQLERRRAAARDNWPALLSMIIGARAERGVATLALPGASGGGADILRRLGLRARADTTGAFADVVEDFFPHPPRAEFFQPEPGCSEATFVGSAADVSGLAASLFTGSLRVLATAAVDRPVDPMSALIVRLPGDLDDAVRPPVRLTWDNDMIVREDAHGYEVRLASAALAEMRAESRRGVRIRRRDIETGGMLLGSINDACGVVWVDAATGPPPDSRLTSLHFEHGLVGVDEQPEQTRAATAGATGFVGMWHTHPDSRAWPSATDEQGMHDLLVPVARAPRRALLLILGGEPQRWSAWLDGGDLPETFVRVASRTRTEPATIRERLVAIVTGAWWPGGYALHPGHGIAHPPRPRTAGRGAHP